jgi:hypothetical protein
MKTILAFMLVTLMTTTASAECLSLRQARKEYPREYLSWRGHHCWFAPHARHKKHKHHSEEKVEKKAHTTPLQSKQEEEWQMPDIYPVLTKEPELTADDLRKHGLAQREQTHVFAQPEVKPVEIAQSKPKAEQKHTSSFVYLLIFPLMFAVLVVLGAFRRSPFRWLA